MPVILLWLMFVSPSQAGDDGVPKIVESFLGEEVVAVARLDLTTLDARALTAWVSAMVGTPAVNAAGEALAEWVEALKASGAREVDLLVEPSGLPGLPTVLVPLGEGVIDTERIARSLQLKPPLSWPATAVIRGGVLGGAPEVIARWKSAAPAKRPEYQAARAAVMDAPVSVVLIPSATMRRAFEETMPTLPEALGGGSITVLSRGLSWAAVRLDVGESLSLRVVAQASDATAAEGVSKVMTEALASASKELEARDLTKEVAARVGQLRPVVEGSQVRLETDPELMAALARVQLRAQGEMAERSKCMNNMKTIALAMHNYHSAKNTFPPAYIASKEGKPLLSWRVAILPYLDQKALYDEFHHDEPWDSPHNKALIARMPEVYRCPSSKAGAGLTTYLAPRGPKAMFQGPKGVTIRDVTDGTSNTILVVDAGDEKAVPWTKPEDWEVGEAPTVEGLLGHHPEGFNTVFADGSARFVRGTVHKQVLRALLTISGGEVVSSDAF